MIPLSFRDVALRRGAFTLSVPALEAEPGTIVGLVGRNGAGKTTLLELLAGLQAPDAGAMRVFGLDPVADPVGVRRQLALMTDDQPLFNLTVAAHLRALAGFYPTWNEALVRELLARFEIDPTKRVALLSKGEGTRVRLVFALAFAESDPYALNGLVEAIEITALASRFQAHRIDPMTK